MMLCCDPGMVSGLAVLSYDPDGGVRKSISIEGDLAYIGESAEEFLSNHRPEFAEVVCERFTITVQTAKNSQAPWSLEAIGMLKWQIHSHWQMDPDATLILQSPTDAKKLVTNDLLRQTGLWHRGGAGHANDALRHGLYRYARHGVRDMFT